MKKLVVDGYVIAIGNNIIGEEISQEEYNALADKIATRPTPPSGFDYRLKADTLEWELYELPQVDDEIGES